MGAQCSTKGDASLDQCTSLDPMLYSLVPFLGACLQHGYTTIRYSMYRDNISITVLRNQMTRWLDF